MPTKITARETVEVTLYVGNCPTCGIVYAMPESYEQKRRDDGREFYCPNGHSMQFRGESREAERKRLEREAEAARQDARWYSERLAERERSNAALRGVVTRQRNRAHAGACPFGCRRSFVNVQRHVASKHPGEKLEGEE